jgi:hypothetical protein
MMPRKRGEILTMPCFGRPLVFGYKPKDQQAEEWLAYLRTLPENQPGASSLNGDSSSSRQDAINSPSEV